MGDDLKHRKPAQERKGLGQSAVGGGSHAEHESSRRIEVRLAGRSCDGPLAASKVQPGGCDVLPNQKGRWRA